MKLAMAVDRTDKGKRKQLATAAGNQELRPPDPIPSPKTTLALPEYPGKYPIINPGRNDVLCGRGSGVNAYAGNKSFRRLVSDHRAEYVRARKNFKADIASRIVNKVQSRGGHFLKRDDATGLWFDIGHEAAQRKTSQALREGLDAFRNESKPLTRDNKKTLVAGSVVQMHKSDPGKEGTASGGETLRSPVHILPEPSRSPTMGEIELRANNPFKSGLTPVTGGMGEVAEDCVANIHKPAPASAYLGHSAAAADSIVEICASGPRTFPTILYEMLEEVERNGLAHIVSWQPHGRAFSVYKPNIFSTVVMPVYFKEAKFVSFLRQVYMHGFRRSTDQNVYYHRLFLRGKPSLAARIRWRKVNETVKRQKSNPAAEPNFSAMKPIQPEQPERECDASSEIDPTKDAESLQKWLRVRKAQWQILRRRRKLQLAVMATRESVTFETGGYGRPLAPVAEPAHVMQHPEQQEGQLEAQAVGMVARDQQQKMPQSQLWQQAWWQAQLIHAQQQAQFQTEHLQNQQMHDHQNRVRRNDGAANTNTSKCNESFTIGQEVARNKTVPESRFACNHAGSEVDISGMQIIYVYRRSGTKSFGLTLGKQVRPDGSTSVVVRKILLPSQHRLHKDLPLGSIVVFVNGVDVRAYDLPEVGNEIRKTKHQLMLALGVLFPAASQISSDSTDTACRQLLEGAAQVTHASRVTAPTDERAAPCMSAPTEERVAPRMTAPTEERAAPRMTELAEEKAASDQGNAAKTGDSAGNAFTGSEQKEEDPLREMKIARQPVSQTYYEASSICIGRDMATNSFGLKLVEARRLGGGMSVEVWKILSPSWHPIHRLLPLGTTVVSVDGTSVVGWRKNRVEKLIEDTKGSTMVLGVWLSRSSHSCRTSEAVSDTTVQKKTPQDSDGMTDGQGKSSKRTMTNGGMPPGKRRCVSSKSADAKPAVLNEAEDGNQGILSDLHTIKDGETVILDACDSTGVTVKYDVRESDPSWYQSYCQFLVLRNRYLKNQDCTGYAASLFPVEVDLMRWVSEQRKMYAECRSLLDGQKAESGIVQSTLAKMALLKSVGFVWMSKLDWYDFVGYMKGTHDTEWRSQCLQYTNFLFSRGHGNAPNHSAVGMWCRTQRRQRREGILHSDKIRALSSLGFDWSEQADEIADWHKMLERVKNHCKGHKNCLLMPPSDVDDAETALGMKGTLDDSKEPFLRGEHGLAIVLRREGVAASDGIVSGGIREEEMNTDKRAPAEVDINQRDDVEESDSKRSGSEDAHGDESSLWWWMHHQRIERNRFRLFNDSVLTPTLVECLHEIGMYESTPLVRNPIGLDAHAAGDAPLVNENKSVDENKNVNKPVNENRNVQGILSAPHTIKDGETVILDECDSTGVTVKYVVRELDPSWYQSYCQLLALRNRYLTDPNCTGYAAWLYPVEDPALLMFVNEQRKMYAECRTLLDGQKADSHVVQSTLAKMALLKSVGFTWISKLDMCHLFGCMDGEDKEWKSHCLKYVDFVFGRGHGMAPDYSGVGSWCRTQRRQRQKGNLSSDKIRALSSLGFDWSEKADFVAHWYRMLLRMEEHQKLHGNCLVMPPPDVDDDNEIESWKACGSLGDVGRDVDSTEDQADDGNTNENENAETKANIHQGDKEGEINRQRSGSEDTCVDESSLWWWTQHQRIERSRLRFSMDSSLTTALIERLDEIGFIWTAQHASWIRDFRDLKAYTEENDGSSTQIERNEGEERVERLRAFVKKMRTLCKQVKAKERNDERRKKRQSQETADAESAEVGGISGAGQPVGGDEPPSDHDWGSFSRGKLRRCARNEINADAVRLLNSINFDKNIYCWGKERKIVRANRKLGQARDDAWEEKFLQLCEYKKRTGSTCPFQTSALGRWVKLQRRNGRLKEACLTKERIRKLDSIDFAWCLPGRKPGQRGASRGARSDDSAWEAKFQKLCEYRELTGHTRVPFNEPTIGKWVASQRHFYHQQVSCLTEERIMKLESIDFVWRLRGRRGRGRSTKEEILREVQEARKASMERRARRGEESGPLLQDPQADAAAGEDEDDDDSQKGEAESIMGEHDDGSEESDSSQKSEATGGEHDEDSQNSDID